MQRRRPLMGIPMKPSYGNSNPNNPNNPNKPLGKFVNAFPSTSIPATWGSPVSSPGPSSSVIGLSFDDQTKQKIQQWREKRDSRFPSAVPSADSRFPVAVPSAESRFPVAVPSAESNPPPATNSFFAMTSEPGTQVAPLNRPTPVSLDTSLNRPTVDKGGFISSDDQTTQRIQQWREKRDSRFPVVESPTSGSLDVPSTTQNSPTTVDKGGFISSDPSMGRNVAHLQNLIKTLQAELTSVKQRMEQLKTEVEEAKSIRSHSPAVTINATNAQMQDLETKLSNTCQNVFESTCVVFGKAIGNLHIYEQPDMSSPQLQFVANDRQIQLHYPIISSGESRWMKTRMVDPVSAELKEGFVPIFSGGQHMVGQFKTVPSV